MRRKIIPYCVLLESHNLKIVHVSKMNDLLDVALGLLGQKIVVSNERIVIGAYILQIENTRAWLYTKKN